MIDASRLRDLTIAPNLAPLEEVRAIASELERWRSCARSLGRVHQPEDLHTVAAGVDELRAERDQARRDLVAAMQTIEAASLALGGNTGHGDREQLEQPGELEEVDRG